MDWILNAAGAIWKKLPPGVRTLLSRMTHQTFTVSVAGVIRNPNGQVLLLNHVLRPHSGWGLPGGFVERREQPTDAFIRETAEETGIVVTDVQFLTASTTNKHVEILFTARTRDEPGVRSREITELGWFDVDKLPEAMNSRLRDTVQKVLRPDI